MSEEHSGGLDVIAVTFQDDDKAYAGLAALKQLDDRGTIDLTSAAVVTREANGTVHTKDQAGETAMLGTATGGITGLLIGIIGGPVGVLVGGATGLLVGSLVDMDDEEDTDSVLAKISGSVRFGHNTLLAELGEPDDAVVDNVMALHDGTVVRRPVRDVEAEIAAAEAAQREAKKKARKRLHKERHEHHQHEIDEKISQLKAKLPGHHQSPDTQAKEPPVGAGASA